MDTTTAEPLVGDVEPLTALDRCDACSSAAAKVRVTLASGEILFCQHCGNKNVPILQSRSLIVALRDEREFAVTG